MSLSKEQIFTAQDIETIEVNIPKWGGSVKVRGMSIIDRINFEKEKKQDNLSDSELILKLVFLTCVDDNGNKLFSSEEDFKRLQEKSPESILKIFNESIKLNSLSDERLEEKAENFPNDHS